MSKQANLGFLLGFVIMLLALSDGYARHKSHSLPHKPPPPISGGSGANIYIAQVATGLDDGSSCANAHAVTFFNTAGNWGVGASQIGAGTTVHLCGTITTQLIAQGNGASGS